MGLYISLYFLDFVSSSVKWVVITVITSQGCYKVQIGGCM